MSAAFLWIILPLIVALLLLLLHKRQVLSTVLAAMISAALAALAFTIPDDLILRIQSLQWVIKPSLSVFGRELSLSAQVLPVVGWFYLITFIWVAISGGMKLTPWFRAAALGMTALFVSALTVEPFLYAALIIELAVILSIPVLITPGSAVNASVVRYLVFQTLGMPFILFTGWLLAGVTAAPTESVLVTRVIILLALGFAFWLAVFPFHSWVAELAKIANAWVFSFVMLLLPTAVLFFMLIFFDRYSWLRNDPIVYQALQMMGAVMIVAGGLWCAVQKNIGRAFGFVILVETGFSLLIVGMRELHGLDNFAMILLPRALGYLLWAFCQSKLAEQYDDLDLATIKGALRKHPYLCSGLLVAQLSLAGVPLLASYPIKQLIWMNAIQTSLMLGVWVMLGSIGPIIFAVRMISDMAAVTDEEVIPLAGEKRAHIIWIMLNFLMLVLIGLLPHFFLPWLKTLLGLFSRL